MDETPLLPEVLRLMDRLYVGAPGASLRAQDRRKAVEVAALLAEVRRTRPARPVTLVDAAAGKAYVGLLAAELVLGPGDWVLALERDPRRAALATALAARLDTKVAIACHAADVADAQAWPEAPEVVTALHACGPAADAVIERAVAARARRLLLVPCCTGRGVRDMALAAAAADRQGIPRHAPVRRRYLQALVDAARTLRLEAAGYETEVVELVAPTITPHNLLWRARLVAEPRRMAAASAALALLAAPLESTPKSG